MATAVRTPRVNNNDDVVKLSHIYVDRGAKIHSGDPLADVETEKATFTVESEHDGYVLAVNGGLGEMLSVGSVLVWLGDAPDEAVETQKGESPQTEGMPAGSPAWRAESSLYGEGPSLMALLLLK